MTQTMTGELAGALETAVQANSRVNDVLCAHLTPEGRGAVTPGGGMTAAQHLAHMAGPLPTLYDDTREDEFVAQGDPARAAAVLREVRAAALQTATRGGGQGDLPHPSTAQFLTHRLIHDAHHRGQVLLALKCGGFPLPGEDALWGPLRGE